MVPVKKQMLDTGSEFNMGNIPNQETLVAKMSRREINVNLGKLRRKREGKMRITGLSLALSPAPSPTFSCFVPMRR